MQKKQGLPETNDLVICTVKKILFHSVFVDLDEYQNIEGMIHISEISPGRIRNIRDFVREGKKIVCKVLKVNTERGHIDLSLRRVGRSESINKTYEYKQEIKAEKLLDSVAKKLKKENSVILNEIGSKLIKEFGSINKGLSELSEDNTKIKTLALPKIYESTLLESINEKIKKPEVNISATIELSSTAQNGIIKIKKILGSLIDETTKVNYISAPKYKVLITADDYKTAENKLINIKEKLEKLIHEEGCSGDLVKDKKK